MIRDALSRILSDYLNARSSAFAGHPLAQFITSEAPALVRASVVLDSEFYIVGSAGKGNWVGGPWIAVLDPLVTDSAQEGYYPVYLFAASMDRVYLSLNQGVTALRKELGTVAARKLLESRAAILGSRLDGGIPAQFSTGSIELGPRDGGSLLELYERGHVLGRMYVRDRLPSDAELARDLEAMATLYRRATALGGTDDLTAQAADENEEESAENANERLEEGRRWVLHRKLERNGGLSRKAKQIHGYACMVCGFSFAQTYGQLGEQFIEAHHLTPLHTLPPDGGVSLSPRHDFAVVCANCHRMIHRKGAPATFDEFVKRFGRATDQEDRP